MCHEKDIRPNQTENSWNTLTHTNEYALIHMRDIDRN